MSLKSNLLIASGLILLSLIGGGLTYRQGVTDGVRQEQGRAALEALTSNVAALGVQDAVNGSAMRHAARQTAADAASREIDHEIAQISRDPAYDDICIGIDGVRWLEKSRTLANGGDLSSAGVTGTAQSADGISAVSDPARRVDDGGAVPDQP